MKQPCSGGGVALKRDGGGRSQISSLPLSHGSDRIFQYGYRFAFPDSDSHLFLRKAHGS